MDHVEDSALEFDGHHLERSAILVSEWMTPDPTTVDPLTDADDAADVMLSNGFRHLPVLEGSTLAGIVSLRDILAMRIGCPR